MVDQVKPDGHSLLIMTKALLISPLRGESGAIHQRFAPIILLHFDPAAIAVATGAPWKTLQDFIREAEAHPGQRNIGNPERNSIWDLAVAGLEQQAQMQLQHLSYEGEAAALQALQAGEIDALSINLLEVEPQVKAGTVRLLGVMAETRLATLPEIPTALELGIDLVLGAWTGIGAPVATQKEWLKRLHDGFKRVADSPQFQAVMRENRMGFLYKGLDSFAEFLRQQNDRLQQILRTRG